MTGSARSDDPRDVAARLVGEARVGSNGGMHIPSGAEDPPDRPRSDVEAVAYGVAAMILACVPPAFFLAGLDDGPRGAWAFADARRWVGLANFCFASLIGVVPVLLLARLGRDRARRPLAALPAVIALFLAMPMIPGAVMQVLWWVAG